MLNSYTARYTKISAGYMGQLVEWPEVLTEGKTVEDCRESLQDALKEMIAAYRQMGREIPPGGALIEQIPVEKAPGPCEISRAKRLRLIARGKETFHLSQGR
jgi:predicted RNase H-like HicB family nuclease